MAGNTVLLLVIVVNRKPELLQVVRALGPAGCLASGLHSRQEQVRSDRDDSDHDQELDQGEALRTQPPRKCHGFPRDVKRYDLVTMRNEASRLLTLSAYFLLAARSYSSQLTIFFGRLSRWPAGFSVDRREDESRSRQHASISRSRLNEFSEVTRYSLSVHTLCVQVRRR